MVPFHQALGGLGINRCFRFPNVFGEGVLKNDTITLIRRYEANNPEWDIPIDYKAACEYLIEDERLTATDKKQLGEITTSDELRKTLEGLQSRTERQQRLLDRLNALSGKNVKGEMINILRPGLPRFMYFSHYDRMAGQIRLDNFPARQQGSEQPAIDSGEQVFVDFLEYSGTSLNEINSATTYEGLNARCEAASNRITEQLLEYWTQNPNLEIEVRVTKAEPQDAPPFNQGVIARSRVRNNLHKMSVPFSERSAGFIWFFSFLVRLVRTSTKGWWQPHSSS